MNDKIGTDMASCEVNVIGDKTVFNGRVYKLTKEGWKAFLIGDKTVFNGRSHELTKEGWKALPIS